MTCVSIEVFSKFYGKTKVEYFSTWKGKGRLCSKFVECQNRLKPYGWGQNAALIVESPDSLSGLLFCFSFIWKIKIVILTSSTKYREKQVSIFKVLYFIKFFSQGIWLFKVVCQLFIKKHPLLSPIPLNLCL